jgi:hypothetical protein
MTIRTAIIIAIILAIGIPLVTWSIRQWNKPKIAKNAIVPVTASGLEEIGVKLIPAYPDRSWREMILTNESDHHLIAVVMTYEMTGEDGQKGFGLNVLMRPEVSLETDPAKIAAFLTKYPDPYPLIPPHSKWLVGVGMQNLRFTDTLPSFEEARNFSSIEEDTPPVLKGVHVFLDGVILEDGRTVGPQTRIIRQVLIDYMP